MSVVLFRLLVTLGSRFTPVLLTKASKLIYKASGIIKTMSELRTNAGVGPGLSFLVITVIGFFTAKPCSRAAASLGIIWRLNILRIRSKLSINSLRARHMLSVHITEPAVSSRLILRVRISQCQSR